MKLKMYLTTIVMCLGLIINAQEPYNQKDKMGRPHGKWLKKYDNGNTRYEGEFNHGREVGIFKFYDEKGSKHPVVTKQHFVKHDSVQVTFFNENGQLESKGMMLDKKRAGKWQYFIDSGKVLIRSEYYKDNKLDGVSTVYYKTEKPAEITNYKNNKLNGRKQVFDKNGNPLEDVTYKDGKLDGPVVVYNTDGMAYAKGQYSKGLKTGVWSVKVDGKWVKTDNPNAYIKSKPLSKEVR